MEVGSSRVDYINSWKVREKHVKVAKRSIKALCTHGQLFECPWLVMAIKFVALVVKGSHGTV